MSSQTPTRLARYKNPKIVGPGVWYSMHLLAETAAESGNVNDFNLAYLFIKSISDNFPCMICRNHMNEYAKVNPLEKFKSVVNPDGTKTSSDANGLAVWVYELHNNATRNTQSNHQPEDYGGVMRFFRSSDGVCDEDCGNDEHDEDLQSLEKAPDYGPLPVPDTDKSLSTKTEEVNFSRNKEGQSVPLQTSSNSLERGIHSKVHSMSPAGKDYFDRISGSISPGVYQVNLQLPESSTVNR
jgi:hypothetical protein